MANEPLNPITPESEQGTSIEKFKTSEARDKAYLDLEKFSHDQAQRLADLEKRLDAQANSQPQPEQDQRSFTDLYPSRQQQDAGETELASRLLTNPSQVLREHGEYVRNQTMQQMHVYVQNMEMINRFKSDNPDLAKHEEIVGMFVKRQDQRLSPKQRLDKAIPEARAYLASIAKSGNTAQPSLDPNTYVEAPAGQAVTSTAPVKAASEEDDLTEFIRERSAIQAKKRL